jgi:hypothetical protein
MRWIAMGISLPTNTGFNGFNENFPASHVSLPEGM